MYRIFLFLTLFFALSGLSCAVAPKDSATLTEKDMKLISTIVADMPAPSELPVIEKLPDPFMFLDGTRMTSKAEWPKRKYEISQLVQKYVYGPLPGKPESVTGKFTPAPAAADTPATPAAPAAPQGARRGGFGGGMMGGMMGGGGPRNTLTVTCTEGGKTISFDVSITYPPEGKGKAPYPAIIGIGGSTLPKNILDDLGIAVINFPNNELGAQGNAGDRGKGKFYELYGSDHQGSSMIAWAWGVSRMIDALEQVPEAKINPAKLGVTGCSRNGKGALVCGVFDDRIALTLPVESGSGGVSSWRVADQMLEAGVNVQTARQIVNENTWLAPIFKEFGLQITKLPVDQHMVVALCAPRPILMIENTSQTWLGDKPCYVTAVAAHKIWEALGVPDKMGFVQNGGHSHCQFIDVDELKAFCTKFLLDGEAETNIVKTDGNFADAPSEWIDWDVSSLK